MRNLSTLLLGRQRKVPVGLLLVVFAFVTGCLVPSLLQMALLPQAEEANEGQPRGPSFSSANLLKSVRFWRRWLKVQLPERLVHLDLKGAPPRLDYLKQLLPLFAKLGATGLLVEYEDMFPYGGNLSVLPQANAYTADELASFLRAAADNRLAVVPLVQTFGHLEFLLKHQRFRHLREVDEYPQTICPSKEGSMAVLADMLEQVMRAHPNIDSFHMGGDEAYQVAEDEACRVALERRHDGSTMRLMLAHIAGVASLVRRRHGRRLRRLFVWYDMFEKADAQLLDHYNLGNLVTPVVWGYKEDVTSDGYFDTAAFDRFSQVFHEEMVASAFKGANGPATVHMDVVRYLRTHQSYFRLLQQNPSLRSKVNGIILTGWQRYDHFATLCELLPVAIPSLAVNLLFVASDGLATLPQLESRAAKLLGCSREVQSRVDDEYALLNGDASSSITSPIERRLLRSQAELLKSRLSPIKRRPLFTDCRFAGHEVFEEFERLLMYQVQLEAIFNTSYVRGWLSAYNRRHHYSNSYIAKNMRPLLEKALNKFLTLRSRLRRQLDMLFFEETADEILLNHVDGHIGRLREAINSAKWINRRKVFPARPLTLNSSKSQ